jgi:hypothetical protein
VEDFHEVGTVEDYYERCALDGLNENSNKMREMG